MMPLLLLSCKPVTMLRTGLSPSFCWFAMSISAVIRLSHSPNDAASALKTFPLSAVAPICTTTILVCALHSYWPPHAAHHQLQCFFFLLLPSPCPVDTHHTLSSTGKQLQCGQTYDKVTPPIPSTGAVTRLQKVRALSQNFTAQCSGGRCPPRQPCHGPLEASQRSIHRAFLNSSLKLSQSPDFFALHARRIIWALQSLSAFLSTCFKTYLKRDSFCH